MPVHNLIIFGPPGAGKGTQSEVIRDNLSLFHLSTGDMLREAIKNGTETGKLAKEFTDSGRLVPDEVVIKIVEEKVASLGADKGMLLDGFPRTLSQAEALDKMLAGIGRNVDAVIVIEVPDEAIVARLGGRRVCPSCNRVYHTAAKPPLKEGVCDGCGGGIVQRSDDNETVIRQRLNTYHEQTSPVMEHYRVKGVVKTVDGSRPPKEVSEAVLALFR